MKNIQDSINDQHKCYDAVQGMHWSDIVLCSYCQSSSVVKRNASKWKDSGCQNYKCKDCGKIFNDSLMSEGIEETPKIKEISERRVDEVDIKIHRFGRFDLVVAYLRKVGFDELVNELFSKKYGPDPEIPYGVLGMIFIANLITNQYPLCRIKENFEGLTEYEIFDIKGTFGVEIEVEKLTDDRFGKFLDRLMEVGVKKLFTTVSLQSMKEYRIPIGDINSDTTSRIMWGEYKTPAVDSEGEIFEITRGHSKAKRGDKNQIKIGIQLTNGVVIHGDVLSGNKDDKTYSKECMESIREVLAQIFPNEEFNNQYVIADSAAAIKDVFDLAKGNEGEGEIKMVTRMPDNYLVSKEAMSLYFDDNVESERIEFEKAKEGKVSHYDVIRTYGDYKGIPLAMLACYSYSLEDAKTQKIEKEYKKEVQKLEKLIENTNKEKPFESKKDAEKERVKWLKKQTKGAIYHDVDANIVEVIKPASGRRAKDPTKQKTVTKYQLVVSSTKKPDVEEIKDKRIKQECLFVIASNDLNISSEDMLIKYKGQSAVEVKFQQFKTREYANAIFLKKAERVQALMYMYLLAYQVCSVIEHAVRRGLEEEKETIIGAGGLKKPRPTFKTIFDKFDTVGRQIKRVGSSEVRKLGKMTDDVKKILKYLELDFNQFTLKRETG